MKNNALREANIPGAHMAQGTTLAVLQGEVARLKQEVARSKRELEELSLLNELAVTISTETDFDRMLETIVEKSREAVGAEQGEIMLMQAGESEARELHTLVRQQFRNQDLKPLRLGIGLRSYISREKTPMILDDPAQDPKFSRLGRELKGIRSLLTAPLQLSDHYVGSINLINKQQDCGFDQDDLQLLRIIATQSVQVIEHARLLEEERAKQRMERELNTAHDIQACLLEVPPSHKLLDLAALNLTAGEVGGDYYDFIAHGDQHLGLALGDVSGKGVPAALLMANLQALLRSQALLGHPVAQCVGTTNFLLYKSLDPVHFATLFYGIFDEGDRTFQYTNAGHNAPLLVQADGNVDLLREGGIPVGILDEFDYQEGCVSLTSGDALVIYSDGVTEALDMMRTEFGEERLIETVLNHRHMDATELLKQIVDTVHSFCGAAEQYDDITLVVAKMR